MNTHVSFFASHLKFNEKKNKCLRLMLLTNRKRQGSEVFTIMKVCSALGTLVIGYLGWILAYTPTHSLNNHKQSYIELVCSLYALLLAIILPILQCAEIFNLSRKRRNYSHRNVLEGSVN